MSRIHAELQLSRITMKPQMLCAAFESIKEQNSWLAGQRGTAQRYTAALHEINEISAGSTLVPLPHTQSDEPAGHLNQIISASLTLQLQQEIKGRGSLPLP
jgi:hypothetical protein